MKYFDVVLCSVVGVCGVVMKFCVLLGKEWFEKVLFMILLVKVYL